MAYGAHATQSIPNKFFEYLAAGVAIVSSLKGELEELVRRENLGRNYEAGDSGSLVKTLEYLCADESRLASMGCRSKELFLRKYSAECVYRDFADHLTSLASVPV